VRQERQPRPITIRVAVEQLKLLIVLISAPRQPIGRPHGAANYASRLTKCSAAALGTHKNAQAADGRGLKALGRGTNFVPISGDCNRVETRLIDITPLESGIK
jgi:hypothetical protein